MLRGWTEVVSGYQRMITGFFDLYAQVFGFPVPSKAEESPSPTPEDEATKDEKE